MNYFNNSIKNMENEESTNYNYEVVKNRLKLALIESIQDNINPTIQQVIGRYIKMYFKRLKKDEFKY